MTHSNFNIRGFIDELFAPDPGERVPDVDMSLEGRLGKAHGRALGEALQGGRSGISASLAKGVGTSLIGGLDTRP